MSRKKPPCCLEPATEKLIRFFIYVVLAYFLGPPLVMGLILLGMVVYAFVIFDLLPWLNSIPWLSSILTEQPGPLPLP